MRFASHRLIRLVFDRLRDKFNFIVVILSSAFFCLYCAKFSLEFIIIYRFLDLGHQLHNYELTFLGAVPYIDFWANWWGPASFYLNALAFKLFGVSIYSVNLLLATVMVVSTAALFCISERVVPKPVALIIALVSLLWGNLTLNLPYSGWYASCFGLLALLGFIKSLESTHRKSLWLMATGMALGLTFSFKQHIGVLNSVVIAVAAALSLFMAEGRDRQIGPAAPRNPVFFRRLTILCYLLLLLPGHIIIPSMLLRARYLSEAGIDGRIIALFFLPVFIINIVLLMVLVQAPLFSQRSADYRSVFVTMVKRETALMAGFLLVVAPWFAYFSKLVGWKEFYRLILLVHPIQENFVGAYFEIMPDVIFTYRSVVFFLSMSAACAAIALMFIFSRSLKILLASTALSTCLLIALIFLALPIGPQVGRMVSFASYFDPEHFVYCDDPRLVGPMLYFFPIVESILLAALLRKGRGKMATLLSSRKLFVLLTLTAFNVYNLISMASFVDRAHLQMILFPWLALIGYAAYLIYDRACSLMSSPDFAARWRRLGILTAVAFFFLVPYVGKALFIVYLQYDANANYSERASQLSGEEYMTLEKVGSRKGAVYINHAMKTQMELIVKYIQDNSTEQDYLFGAPCTTMFNFLADRRFPSKYGYLTFNSLAEVEKDELLRNISENQPMLYIFDDFQSEEVRIPGPTETEKFVRDFPAIEEFISREYKFERKIGRFHLYKKREPIVRSFGEE